MARGEESESVVAGEEVREGELKEQWYRRG